MDVKMKRIKNEFEFARWFKNNFKKLGYSKILKKDHGKFPDFLMLKNGKEIGVELETLSSNFNLHNHDKKRVDEIVCIKKDIELGLPIIEVKVLKYNPRIRRISFTIDPSTANKLKLLLKTEKYRNKSHVIEEAIKLINKKNEK